jgi:hypothetical protein
LGGCPFCSWFFFLGFFCSFVTVGAFFLFPGLVVGMEEFGMVSMRSGFFVIEFTPPAPPPPIILGGIPVGTAAGEIGAPPPLKPGSGRGEVVVVVGGGVSFFTFLCSINCTK